MLDNFCQCLDSWNYNNLLLCYFYVIDYFCHAEIIALPQCACTVVIAVSIFYTFWCGEIFELFKYYGIGRSIIFHCSTNDIIVFFKQELKRLSSDILYIFFMLCFQLSYVPSKQMVLIREDIFNFTPIGQHLYTN